MTPERIKEIQLLTASPESQSVQQALLQVWNECSRETASLQEQVRKLREGLGEIDKSLYIGDDLNDKEVLDFYVEVIKTCKEYIKLLLTETEG